MTSYWVIPFYHIHSLTVTFVPGMGRQKIFRWLQLLRPNRLTDSHSWLWLPNYSNNFLSILIFIEQAPLNISLLNDLLHQGYDLCEIIQSRWFTYFSLRFSGSKFLINLRREFRIRKVFHVQGFGGFTAFSFYPENP